MINVSKLSVSVKEFLFKNVTDGGIAKFVLHHEGETHEMILRFTADGSDVTIQTEDDCWTDETETWLATGKGNNQKRIGPGVPVLGRNRVITYLVRHQ